MIISHLCDLIRFESDQLEFNEFSNTSDSNQTEKKGGFSNTNDLIKQKKGEGLNGTPVLY